MSNTDHPDTEQLSAYLAEPLANSFSQLSLHLLDCHDCRDRLELLSGLNKHLQEINNEQYQQALQSDHEFSEYLDSQAIEQFVDDKLDDKSSDHLQAFLQGNGQALKTALHYASHSACMKRECANHPQSMGLAAQDSGSKVGFWHGLKESLTHWLTIRLPAWLSIPAGAVVAGLLTVTLLPQTVYFASKEAIVAYQDNPVIQFRHDKGLPGIGFFTNANKTAKPYENISASIDKGGMIKITWPEVSGAVSYTMHLKLFKDGQQVSVGKTTTTDNHASFKRILNDTGHRYTWHLQGKTDTGALFSSKGGFVIKVN